MAGASVGLALTGSASIPERDLDLKGTASLMTVAAGGAAAPAVELPFMVQGPWDDPIILPDPQSRIQRSGAAAPILDVLRKNGASNAVRSAIERLTGTARPAPAATESAPTLAGTSSPSEQTGETPAAADQPEVEPASPR
jgi:AsmA protein